MTNAGKIFAQIAKEHTESEFEKYRISQDRLFQSDLDKLINGIKSEEYYFKGVEFDAFLNTAAMGIPD